MATLQALPTEARRLLDLARRDRAAARSELARHSVDEQVALICESPLARRAELLDLAPQPEAVIPRIPPAELCFLAKSVGLHDAGWILEHATPEQIVAGIDLSAWRGNLPDGGELRSWLEGFADAGDDTMQRAAHALDMELLVIQLRERVQVIAKTSDDDWEEPANGVTIDGQFYLIGIESDDDLSDVMQLLRVLFQRDYWVYFRVLMGVQFESQSEMEEWALRWRSGRLQDLGFPPPEDAKRVYAYIRPEKVLELPEEPSTHELGEWQLPVWMPSLPTSDTDRSLFRAMAELSEEERRPLLFAFLALANCIAMADGLPLGEAESMPAALDKAARLASLGLDRLADAKGVPGVAVLRRAPLERLFRVGWHLSGEQLPPDPESD